MMRKNTCLLKMSLTDKNVSMCSEEQSWQDWFVMSFLLHPKIRLPIHWVFE